MVACCAKQIRGYTSDAGTLDTPAASSSFASVLTGASVPATLDGTDTPSHGAVAAGSAAESVITAGSSDGAPVVSEVRAKDAAGADAAETATGA